MTIGIDLGGTNIAAALVDDAGKITCKVSIPARASEGTDAVLGGLIEVVDMLFQKSGLTPADVKSIGIGIPGMMNVETGVVYFSPNLPLSNTDMTSGLKEKFGLPVYINNDANCAALGEVAAGGAVGAGDAVFVTLGTGVGGGIVLGGKVYSGFHGVGSEIGHMITVSGGDECTCGNKGCWERYASAGAIIRRGREAAQAHPESKIYKDVDGKLEDVTAKIVIDAAKAGDETAVKVFDDYVFHLCEGLVSIINLIDPEVIVLGGGVSHAGQFLLDAINKTLPGMVFYKTMPYADIALATLGNDAGIIGAAMLGK